MAKDIDADEAPCGDCPCCEWANETEKHEIEYHMSVARLWREMAVEMEDVADSLVEVLLKINNGEEPDGLEEAIEKYRQAKECSDIAASVRISSDLVVAGELMSLLSRCKFKKGNCISPAFIFSSWFSIVGPVGIEPTTYGL